MGFVSVIIVSALFALGHAGGVAVGDPLALHSRDRHLERVKDSDPIARLNAALEGRYRIERELGEGGMATVYLADDIKHERRVALKVLKPELAAVVGAERFLAEIKTTANPPASAYTAAFRFG